MKRMVCETRLVGLRTSRFVKWYVGESCTQTPTNPRSRLFDKDKREADSSYLPCREYKSLNKPPPICFFCSNTDLRHFLAECEKLKALTPRSERQAVTDAKRCLNIVCHLSIVGVIAHFLLNVVSVGLSFAINTAFNRSVVEWIERLLLKR